MPKENYFYLLQSCQLQLHSQFLLTCVQPDGNGLILSLLQKYHASFFPAIGYALQYFRSLHQSDTLHNIVFPNIDKHLLLCVQHFFQGRVVIPVIHRFHSSMLRTRNCNLHSMEPVLLISGKRVWLRQTCLLQTIVLPE